MILIWRNYKPCEITTTKKFMKDTWNEFNRVSAVSMQQRLDDSFSFVSSKLSQSLTRRNSWNWRYIYHLPGIAGMEELSDTRTKYTSHIYKLYTCISMQVIFLFSTSASNQHQVPIWWFWLSSFVIHSMDMETEFSVMKICKRKSKSYSSLYI